MADFLAFDIFFFELKSPVDYIETEIIHGHSNWSKIMYNSS